jgi:hypothetical protein
MAVFLYPCAAHRFYGAFADRELVGIFALTDEKGRCFKLVTSDLVANLGFLKANIAFGGLRKIRTLVK